MEQNSKHFEINRESWNQRTDLHKDSEFYDLASFKAGKSSHCKIVDELMDGLDGKSLLHLQCHFGMDTLSFVRKGAIATGIDLSDKSIETAIQLSKELDIPANFIRSNVYDIEQALDGQQFDHIFTSYGTIVWLPDLVEWARLIRKHLKAGGTFTIVEFHPALDMFDWDKGTLAYNYFNRGVYEETMDSTYASDAQNLELKERFWIHSLSEVIRPLMAQGMKIEHFNEYDWSPYDCFGEMTERAPGEYIWGKHGLAFPHVFSLQCTVA